MKERGPIRLKKMLWIPGQGPDPDRLHDLAGAFGKPRTPLGEPWFIGEKRYLHDELSAHGIDGASDQQVSAALEDLTSGITYFAEMTVWSEWYGYLLPRILSSPRFQNDRLYDDFSVGLISLSFFNSEKYANLYEADFAAVLSPWIMQSRFWNKGQYLPLRGEYSWKDSWGVIGIDVNISSSLLLTWRYLHPSAIREWLHSVLTIKDVQWRAHFIVWLTRVWSIFDRKASNYPVLKECKIDDLWNQFYKLMISMEHSPDKQQLALIPHENILALQQAIRDEFNQRTYFEWIDQFSAQPEIWPQMEMWLEQVSERYL